MNIYEKREGSVGGIEAVSLQRALIRYNALFKEHQSNAMIARELVELTNAMLNYISATQEIISMLRGEED